MFLKLFSIFALVFLFSTGSFASDETSSGLPEQHTVLHSIEKVWITDDGLTCLIQLNNIQAKQQSCIAFWKHTDNQHKSLVLSTRVPFTTDGNSSFIMFRMIPSFELHKLGESGDYSVYRGPVNAVEWTLSGE